MKHTLTNDFGEQIVCFETDDGLMNLQFGPTGVHLTKERFVEFAALVHRVGQILIDELVEEKIGRRRTLGLNI